MSIIKWAAAIVGFIAFCVLLPAASLAIVYVVLILWSVDAP